MRIRVEVEEAGSHVRYMWPRVRRYRSVTDDGSGIVEVQMGEEGDLLIRLAPGFLTWWDRDEQYTMLIGTMTEYQVYYEARRS